MPNRLQQAALLLPLLFSQAFSAAIEHSARSLEVPWKNSPRGVSGFCKERQRAATDRWAKHPRYQSGSQSGGYGIGDDDDDDDDDDEKHEICRNGPQSRNCWDGTYDLNTDIDVHWPDTGRTVKYYFEVGNVTLAPDGYAKEMQVVNGQYPGPAIEANWGDDIEVTVKNCLTTNGTGIHWHGVRQLGTNQMDGTAGVTECPIAPGQSKTYKFKATQYGTSWWHSHYSVQYSAGVGGPIIIHGPASANYDIDLGALPFSDWFHKSIYTVNAATLHANGPPIADNLLVNGTMTSAFGGRYAETYLTPGRAHLLRLVNMGINNWVNVALDGHSFEVIASDFVPVVPFKTDTLTIAVGQRYDVIIRANQTIGNYWFRVGTGGGGCDGPNANAANLASIFRYRGAPKENPTSSPTVPLSTGCADQTGLIPWVHTQVPQETPDALTLSFTNTVAGKNLIQWYIDDSIMHINFSSPSLDQILAGNDTFSTEANVYPVGEANKFQYWVIQQNQSNIAAVPHPIHLHGHDFFILDTKDNAAWTGDVSRLQATNPTRRDTATLPGRGYLVLAFESDNPGVWLMHCHIPFHTSQGFGVQFAERDYDIRAATGFSAGKALDDQCAAWHEWRDANIPPGYSEGEAAM